MEETLVCLSLQLGTSTSTRWRVNYAILASHVFVPGARLTWVLSGGVTHMQCVSQGHIYSASVLWKFSCQSLFFSLILADFERRIGASEIFELRKYGENTQSAK